MNDLFSVDRRNFLLQIAALWQAAASLSAQHVHSDATKASAPYQFRFLSLNEQTTLRLLAARIAPADEHSGGALAGQVDEYIDFVLSHADPKLQAEWRAGLTRYGAAIAPNTPEAIDAFLTQQCKGEFAPQNQDQLFFILLKTAVVEGFYTSEEGIKKELGYRGMGFVMDWQGCTHEHHKAPAGWQPALRAPETGDL